MLIKILGAALLMASSVGVGLYFAGRDGYRLSGLAQMKKALTVLASEIRFSNALPVAAKNISERTEGAVSKIFGEFGEGTSVLRGQDICSIWEGILDSNKRASYFTAEDMEAFISLGKTFGYLDKEMQIGSIGLLIGYIDGETEIINETREKNKKMYLNLGALGGLALVIMLL